MDEKFDKLIDEMVSEHYLYLEKFFRSGLQIPGLLFSYGGKDMKGILESKNLSEFMWEEAAKGQLHHDFKINKPSFLDKEQTFNFFNELSSDIDEYFQYSIAIIHQIITSTVDLIPFKLNDEDKRIAKHCLDYSELLSTQLITYKNMIHRILSDDVKNENLSDSTKLKTLKAQRVKLVQIFNELNYATLIAIWFRQHVYEYYYGTKENKANSASKIFNFLASWNSRLSNIEKNTEQTVKDGKHNADTLEKIECKQTVFDDLIKRRSDKIIETVENRNKKESRYELTQMDCARIIAEERKINYEAKKSLLYALKMSTETIDKDKNPNEDNIVRTIERWDTGKTKPPVGYSRRISEYEFREWVKKREKKKLDNWIVKIRKSLKMVQTDFVPEAVLDEWMRLNSGNDNDPYGEIKA